MSKIKMERVNAELQKQISKIISNDIKDPRMGDSIVGVTRVKTTPDLKYAKVYLSIYSATKAQQVETLETIKRSKVFIRNQLKSAVNIRTLPDFTFIYDDSFEYGMAIDKILRTIDIPELESDDEE